MFKSKYVLPISLGVALMLSGCASNSPSAPTKVSTPDEFLDASAQELFSTVEKVYKTEYFAIGIPKGWKVLSFDNAKLASYISVEKEDHSTLVTIRVAKAIRKNVDESCQLAIEGFKSNEVQLSADVGVAFGTCVVEGKDNEKDVALWLRQYDDDNSTYSINYTGSLENVGELLSYLVGNEKLMQLMVRPL